MVVILASDPKFTCCVRNAPVWVLTIRSDDLDFAHRKKDLSVVVQRIEDRLTGREEVVFQ
jgi:hypothetical protein